MLFVPSAAAQQQHHHQHCMPTQLNSNLQTTKEDTMPLKFNVSQVTVATQAQATPAQQPTLVKENNNNNVETVVGHKAAKSAEIVAAMRKLDAKLVAYLAATDAAGNDKLDNTKGVGASGDLSPDCDNKQLSHLIDDLVSGNGVTVAGNAIESQLDIFGRVAALKLHMEALTLQPEGMQYMQLLEHEIRPIFTVECQLSQELINQVPRHEQFHVMQFESEKFHSLTLCARFGQAAQRAVKLQLDGEKEPKFGRICFTVWWREPGTCLNEMLGLGVLELSELYEACLLEKCKSVQLFKRGVHFASIYFKVSLFFEQLQLPLRGIELKTKQCSDKSVREVNGNKPLPKAAASTPSSNSGSNMGQADTTNSASNLLSESAHFARETSKVRLLKGFLYANETRNLPSNQSKCDYFLVCRRFWQDEASAATAAADNVAFNYQEQFAIINDAAFLQSVDKQHLQLELWRRVLPTADANGNAESKVNTSIEPFGIVRLPLHHFYIAYKDTTIANHICKGKMPVISIDAWLPIVPCQPSNDDSMCGELKCLLAIGSEEQISHLKQMRGFNMASNALLSPAKHYMISNQALEAHSVPIAPSTNGSQSQGLRKTADLLDILQKVLQQQPTIEATPLVDAAAPTVYNLLLDVRGAKNLPYSTSKRKKGAKRRSANRTSATGGSVGEAPSCYVTFQAAAARSAPSYRSHEGAVYATSVMESTTQPRWAAQFRVTVAAEYLTNPQKCFVLRVWRKTAQSAAGQLRLQPTPLDDAIVGFVALDLSAFQRGGSHIDGWFNIVDFNGRINGQLDVQCALLPHSDNELAAASSTVAVQGVDAVIEQFASTLELSHLNIGQAIKRKYTELEGISQRLRTRLGDVAGAHLSSDFDMHALDDWQPPDTDGYTAADNDWLEFERDISTMPVSVVENSSPSRGSNSSVQSSLSTTLPSVPKQHDE